MMNGLVNIAPKPSLSSQGNANNAASIANSLASFSMPSASSSPMNLTVMKPPASNPVKLNRTNHSNNFRPPISISTFLAPPLTTASIDLPTKQSLSYEEEQRNKQLLLDVPGFLIPESPPPRRFSSAEGVVKKQPALAPKPCHPFGPGATSPDLHKVPLQQPLPPSLLPPPQQIANGKYNSVMTITGAASGMPSLKPYPAASITSATPAIANNYSYGQPQIMKPPVDSSSQVISSSGAPGNVYGKRPINEKIPLDQIVRTLTNPRSGGFPKGISPIQLDEYISTLPENQRIIRSQNHLHVLLWRESKVGHIVRMSTGRYAAPEFAPLIDIEATQAASVCTNPNRTLNDLKALAQKSKQQASAMSKICPPETISSNPINPKAKMGSPTASGGGLSLHETLLAASREASLAEAKMSSPISSASAASNAPLATSEVPKPAIPAVVQEDLAVSTNCISSTAAGSVAGGTGGRTKREAATKAEKCIANIERPQSRTLRKRKNSADNEATSPNSASKSPGAKGSKSAGANEEEDRPKRKRTRKCLGPDFVTDSDFCQFKDCKSPVKGGANLLKCRKCEYTVHGPCIGYSDEFVSQKLSVSSWQCSACKTCAVCSKPNELDLIICGQCDKGYHMGCHVPELQAKPSSAWTCCECEKQNIGKKLRSNGLMDFATSDFSMPSLGSDVFQTPTVPPVRLTGLQSAKAAKVTVITGTGKRAAAVGRPPKAQASNASANKRAAAAKAETSANSRKPAAKAVDLAAAARFAIPAMSDTCPITEMATAPQAKLFESAAKQAVGWKVEEVAKFISDIGFADQTGVFKDQEIDGIALLLLTRRDVLSRLSIRTGPALKLYGRIRKLQYIYSQLQEA